MKTPYEYLASPYTSHDEFVMHWRHEQTERIVAKLTNQGRLIYSPICSWHPLAVKFKLPRDFEFWMKHNLAFLSNASKLLVLRLHGWKESKGMKAEIAFAEENKIPTEYIDP